MLLMQLYKQILKYVWKSKGSSIAKKLLKKNKWEVFAFIVIRTDKAIIIKTARSM